MFNSVHSKGGTARSIKSTSVQTGRNAENVPLRDDRWVKCRKCGFINHLDRSVRASVYSAAGVGITFQGLGTPWGTAPWGSSPWGGSDPVVTAGNGCSFCGTYLYA